MHYKLSYLSLYSRASVIRNPLNYDLSEPVSTFSYDLNIEFFVFNEKKLKYNEKILKDNNKTEKEKLILSYSRLIRCVKRLIKKVSFEKRLLLNRCNFENAL